jgi:hypothetical protein
LFISVHFIASDYCYSVEMEHALERHEACYSHHSPSRSLEK